MKEILMDHGLIVEEASDGSKAVEVVKTQEPGYYHFILMDIQMPNMDGYKATRTIRKFADKEKAEIPIVAMTANAFEEDKKIAFEAGMNGHLAKPIRIDELMLTLTEILSE